MTTLVSLKGGSALAWRPDRADILRSVPGARRDLPPLAWSSSL